MFARVSRLTAIVGALALASGAPASAAVQATGPGYSPWAALSAFASPSASAALCGSAAAATVSVSVQQGAAPGCVFPMLDAPIAAPVEATAAPASSVVVPAASATSLGALPLLLGLASVGALSALLFSRADSQSEPVSP